MHGLVFGFLLRVVLSSFSGLTVFLSKRVELTSSTNSLQRIREALFLVEYGQSPYTGWAFHSPPLILPFLKWTANDDFLCVVPFLLADLVACWVLLKLQYDNLQKSRPLASWYLLNPFGVLTCVGCSLSSFENLFVILSVYGAVSHQPCLAAFSLVLASYIGLHPVLFMVPILLMVYKKGSLNHCVLFLGTSVVSIVSLFFLSSAYLAKYKTHESHFMFPPIKDFEDMDETKDFENAMQGHHWMLETYWYQLRLEDLSPNMGMYWYFFTEMFPFYRQFFLFVFHSLCFIFLIPLSLKFQDQPLLVLFLQSIINSMMKPYPTLGDYSLVWILGLLAVPGVLEWWWFLFMSGALLMVLEPVMWQEWVLTESANSNFYYSMNLLIGLLHICLMSIVLVQFRNLQQERKIKAE